MTVPASKQEYVTLRLCHLDEGRPSHTHLVPLARLISRLSKGDNFAFPSQRWLAEALGKSERTIRRQIRELKDLGLLVVFSSRPVRDPDSGKWRRRQTNRYLIPFRRRKEDKRPSAGKRPSGGKPAGENSSSPPIGHERPMYFTTAYSAPEKDAEVVRLHGQARKLRAIRLERKRETD